MKFKLLIVFFLLLEITTAQNVILVVIDGARYTETFGAENPSANIPYMWNDLRPQGTFYSDFRNTGVTSTNPGHSTLLTGTWQTVLNDGSERPTKPTVFEYYRKEKSAAIEEVYVIAGKEKLNILNYSLDEQYGSEYRASVLAQNLTDNEVYENLVETMDSYHPKLIIVNFTSVDIAGHSGDSTDYINAIHNVDSLVNESWNKIQSDTFYKDNTTLFITNDHGRHTEYFKNHGDDCEGCRHIMLLALGRNIPQANIISTKRDQTNIAASIGHLLGFGTPQAAGSSLFTDSNLQSIQLNIKVYLEGPFTNGAMTTASNIQQSKIWQLPKALWKYVPAALPPEVEIVDSVLVELRTDKNIPSDIRKKGLLTDTGKILDLDELNPLEFNIIPGNYFIVVEHRNHLSVMSAKAVSFP